VPHPDVKAGLGEFEEDGIDPKEWINCLGQPVTFAQYTRDLFTNEKEPILKTILDETKKMVKSLDDMAKDSKDNVKALSAIQTATEKSATETTLADIHTTLKKYIEDNKKGFSDVVSEIAKVIAGLVIPGLHSQNQTDEGILSDPPPVIPVGPILVDVDRRLHDVVTANYTTANNVTLGNVKLSTMDTNLEQVKIKTDDNNELLKYIKSAVSNLHPTLQSINELKEATTEFNVEALPYYRQYTAASNKWPTTNRPGEPASMWDLLGYQNYEIVDDKVPGQHYGYKAYVMGTYWNTSRIKSLLPPLDDSSNEGQEEDFELC
jgi:gas vesicle protein